jgi:hypothetical protein
MNDTTKQLIRDHLANVMARIIHKRTIQEPYDEQEIADRNPFGHRLVPTEIWKGSKFERSFVTSLGQGIFEQLGKIVAIGAGAVEAENQHDTTLVINTWRNEKIERILRDQRSSLREPDWEAEVHEVVTLDNDSFVQVIVKSDLYILRPNGQREFYSFKTVKPNLDQTERAKRDMLRMKAGNPEYETYFALPFNPAGEGELYSNAHKIPYKLFDMDNESCVLIGAELWNKIGDDPNTYNELLEIFEEVGEQYSPIIRRDYLGL